MRQLKFDRNEDGNIAVVSALAMTALMGVTGLALLYNQANWARTELQASLDTAVIAGTTLPDGTPDQQRIAAAAISFKTNLQSSGLADNADFTITVAPQFLVNMTHMSGTTTGTVTNSLGVALGISKMALETTAAAEKIKSDPLCVLALNSTQPASIEVYGNAQFHARDCAVQANSANGTGMKLYGNASASASEFGVTGGYSGQAWSPEPVVGVGKVIDPYASLPVPAAGNCEPVSKSIKSDMTLAPGTYCGGIDVKTGANVTLLPGVYVMKDGQFAVNSGATVTGNEVMIALVGADSYIHLMSNSVTKVTSPRDGTYKNIQFMSDRDLTQSKFEQEWTTILGGATLDYDGVLYLPEQQFWVGGAGGDVIINGNSPTFAMIADKIWAQGNAIFEITQEDRRAMGLTAENSFAYGARLVR